MRVIQLSKDCYQVDGLAKKTMYVRRMFHPELFLAITIAILERHGWQDKDAELFC